MSEENSSRIIGVIGKPYGLDGYVFVRLVTDYPESIKKGDTLYLDEDLTDNITIRDIKHVSVRGKKRLIFKFHSFDTLKDVLGLRKRVLYRSMDDSPLLEDGYYWIDDLVGCDVYIQKERYLGKVIDVEKYAFNDNLLIETIGKDIIIVPMLDDYVGSINIKDKKIVLNMLPEYI